MKKGLVLEGGAMRGMYTAGALDIFMEQNIQVDGVIGVSAGAVFGCYYKSRQIGRSVRYNLKYCKDPRYGKFRSLLKTGDIYEEDFCYHQIPEKLDPFDQETYQSNPVEFYVTCTDVHTGKPVYHRSDKGDSTDVRWMQASASMPLVSRVVSVDGYDLLDGGISDSIPITWFRKQGYEKNIVILTRPMGYRKKKGRFSGIMKHLMKEYPAMAKCMEERYLVYNKTLDEILRLEKAGEVFVLCPSSPFKVSRLESNPQKLKDLYELGRADALKQLDEIRKFLA